MGLGWIRERLTYANVMVSLLTIVVLGGGGAYAAVTLPKNSVKAKQIAPGAVRSSEIKNNAAKGRDIAESTLGTVPSASQATNALHATHADHATSADSATSAANATNATSAGTAANATHAGDADAVGGVTVRGFSYQTPASGTTATLFSLKGLTVTATRSSGNVTARTSVDNAYISSSWVTIATDTAAAASDTDFDTTETFGANTTIGAQTGSIEYVRPDGQRVSVSLQADMASACTLSGHAFGSGEARRRPRWD